MTREELVCYGILSSMAPQADGSCMARVTAVHKERYTLICTVGQVFARLKTGAYYQNAQPLPTVGDFVRLRLVPGGDGQILSTLPRKSLFQRVDPATKGRAPQALAANFDYVFVVQSLNDNFSPARLERYLSIAWQSGGQPVVLLTKADLTVDLAPFLAVAQPVAAGAPVHALSAKTGQGMDALAQYLRPGVAAVLLGSSGVGKSSLVNALCGQPVMTVSAIRQSDDKGRHTTTHRQMLPLPSGAVLMDTPGLRELGIWAAEEGLQTAFADVEQLLGRCKFRNCSHTVEPGCVIRAALADGSLSERRWQNYQQLHRESDRHTAWDKKRAEIERRQQAKWERQSQRAGAPHRKKQRKGEEDEWN